MVNEWFYRADFFSAFQVGASAVFAPAGVQVRNLNLHEYQSKSMFSAL